MKNPFNMDSDYEPIQKEKCVHADCDRTCKYVEAMKQPCQAYKDVTTKPNLPHLADINKEYHERNKAKYQKQVEDAIQATSPNTPELIEIPYIETRFKPETSELIFEDRPNVLLKFFECQNIFECRAILSVPYKGKELPAWIECPLCHSTMYTVTEISSLKGE